MGAKANEVPQILDWIEVEDWKALQEAFPLSKVNINLEE
tara:strand:+ start:439 stop:555 length:117 start_codon:yes stop_codon:yes gene_type:complete